MRFRVTKTETVDVDVELPEDSLDGLTRAAEQAQEIPDHEWRSGLLVTLLDDHGQPAR